MKTLSVVYPDGYACKNCSIEIFDEEFYLCDDCKKELPFLIGSLCLHCANPITGAGHYCLKCKGKKFICDKVVSPFIYDGIVKKFIINLKYNNVKHIALPLAKYMAISFLKENLPCDYVIAVPLCEKRYKERGYNQAELLGIPFAKEIGVDYRNDILYRIKETPSQTTLSGKDRAKNMIDAFVIKNKKDVKNKIIVIVDDVYTTGATLTECAKQLKNSGAKAVYGVTASHSVIK